MAFNSISQEHLKILCIPIVSNVTSLPDSRPSYSEQTSKTFLTTTEFQVAVSIILRTMKQLKSLTVQSDSTPSTCRRPPQMLHLVSLALPRKDLDVCNFTFQCLSE